MSDTAYRLWYEYLRETDPNTWTPTVRMDFAGVLELDFDEWFSRVKFDLFLDTFKRPTTEHPVYRIDREDYDNDRDYLLSVIGEPPKDEDPDDFKGIFQSLNHIADVDDRMLEALRLYEIKVEEHFMRKQHLVLVINLSNPKEKLLRLIDIQVTAAMGKLKKGRPAERRSFAKYPFARRPDISSLEIALVAYRLRQTGMPLWQVANEIATQFPILKDQKIQQSINSGAKGDLDSVNKKKVLEAAAGRYLKLATAVLDGVTKGIFPAK